MRNTLFAAAAAFALILGTGPTFSAENSGGNDQATGQATQDQMNRSNESLDSKCAAIMASPAGHPAGDVEYCKSKKP